MSDETGQSLEIKAVAQDAEEKLTLALVLEEVGSAYGRAFLTQRQLEDLRIVFGLPPRPRLRVGNVIDFQSRARQVRQTEEGPNAA